MAKPRTFAKKFSFAKLYGFCQIVWSSAELSANAVEKWVYHVTMSGIVSSNLFEKAAIMPSIISLTLKLSYDRIQLLVRGLAIK